MVVVLFIASVNGTLSDTASKAVSSPSISNVDAARSSGSPSSVSGSIRFA